MEHWEELAKDGLRFVWEDSLFRPGTDSFLLADLPQLRPGMRVCDLGCGTGLLGMLLLQRQRELTVTGVELQSAPAQLGRTAIRENRLEDRFAILQGDLRDIRSLLPAGETDLVICNPPYFPTASGVLMEQDSLRLARSEVDCTLADICRAAAYLLRWGGSVCLVHKPERLTDLLSLLRENNCEPKRLRLICKSPGAAPSLILVEGRRGGKPGLRIDPPFCLQDEAGAPNPEIDRIYFRH